MDDKINNNGKDEFDVLYDEYPECPDDDCSKDNGVGLNYIGLRNGENPHTRTDGGATFYCYACGCTFN